MSGITVKVEVAWVANPYGALTWTDISAYVTDHTITRGRQYELDQNEAGTCVLDLVNTDGRFDPTNTASPYYPYVLPFRPIRVTAIYGGTSYARFYGYTEKFVQTWPMGAWGNCQLSCVDAFKAQLGFSPGYPYDAKIEMDYDVYTGMAGASSSVWNFWAFDETSAPFAGDNGGSLTVIGDAVAKASPSPCRTGVVLDGSSFLQCLTTGPGAGELWFNASALPAAGYMDEIIADNGGHVPSTAGTQPWRTFDVGASGVYSPTLTAGVWRAAPNLMPSDNSASFETSVSDWTAGSGVTISRSTSAAHDGSASMAFNVPAVSAGHTATLATGPACTATAGGSYAFSAWVQLSGTTTGVGLEYSWYNSGGTLISTTGEEVAGPTGSYTANTWFRLAGSSATAPAGTASVRVLLVAGGSGPTPTGTGYMDSVQLLAGTLPSPTPAFTLPSQGSSSYLTVAVPNNTATSLDIYDLIPAPATGQWHLLSWADGHVTGGTSFCALDGSAQTISRTVTGWTSSYSTPNTMRVGNGLSGTVAALYVQSAANANVIVPSAVYAAQHYQYGIAPGGQARTQDFPAELTGSRVADVLTAIGWPTAMTDIDAGLSTMPATGSVVGKTGVSLIQDAATAEMGNVFISSAGKVTFRQRTARNSQTPVVTFGDGPSAVNLATNPSWESGSTGWTVDIGAWAVVSGGVFGTHAWQTTASTPIDGYAHQSIALPAGTWTVSLYVQRASVAGTGGGSGFQVQNAGVGIGYSIALGTNGWRRESATFTLASAATVVIYTQQGFGGTCTGTTTFDGLQVETGSTPTVFNPGGSAETPYTAALALDFDDTHLANDVTITQDGATPAYTFDASDVTSENLYGVRGLSVSAQLTSQADVQGMAATLLAQYKNPLSRLEALPFELRSNPASVAAVLARELGDCVQVKRRPPGATPITLVGFVDGISETVDDGQYTVSLQISPQLPNTTY